MLISLEPRGIFGSNFALCILTLSSHWYENRLRGFTEHHFGRSGSFGEMLLNVEPRGAFGSNFESKTVTRLHRASLWPIKLF